ncbi:LamG-like jellyroll fold domain-containing protein [Lacinutrix sp. MedPE-SW]|uniref:LamG-like jellyroll fold domain-containing protein n=1 Tax=Lacinutrix sp. MedPE-SW TaxID=1860087 RepID=UPI000922E19A|nr:LamG-like jellyroll fold domain-containing protein [Lacinutrix sp. MedPE-SW]OIQ22862.1 MAG: MAM protein [Lacinutrix sp. MedPE-SW]
MKNFTLKTNLFAILLFCGILSSTTSNAQIINQLGFYDFESGTQGWTSTGLVARTNNATYAYSNTHSFWLRDGNSNTSIITSPAYSLAIYDKVDLKFFFTPYSMEAGDDFYVDYNDGGLFSNWQTVARFVAGNIANKTADFHNGNYATFYSKTVTILTDDYTFPILPTGRFRIRCSASATSDYVMIDDITITGTTYATPTTGPGGVNANLDLWLKADRLNGTTYGTDGGNVDQWVDNGKGNNAEVVVSGQEPIYRNNAGKNMNFNPVIEFENNNNTAAADMTYLSNRHELKGTGGFNTNDMFVVLMPDPNITATTNPLDTFTGSDPLAESYAEDVTGFGYGSYTARTTNERLSFCIGTTSETPSNPTENGYGRADTNSGTDYNKIQILNIRQNAANTDMEIYFNANQVGNETNDISRYATINNGRYWLGRSQYWNGSFDGRIAEVITYNSRNSDTNLTQAHNRIQSYLAIKYGITLGVNGTSQDYVDSQGNIIWDQSANAGYNYDITGIGRDDASELNQKQSKSVNSELDGIGETRGLLTIGLNDIYTTNSENQASNPETFNDGEFLTWGNNNASLDAAPITVAVDMSSGIPGLSTPVNFLGMQRIWKVVENGGDIGEVKVSIPQNAIRNIFPPGSYYMFISDVPIFDPTADYRLMTSNGGNLEASYDFDGTKYVTFGYAPQIVVERSIYFDDTQDYLDVGNNLDLNPSGFTISAWIKRDAADSGTSSIMSKRDVSFTQGYDFRIVNNNRIQMRWLNGGTVSNLTSTTRIPDDEWHHVAAIYNGTRLFLYIDGVLERSANRGAPAPTDDSFFIAAAAKNNPRQFFRGNIDEVRVWDTDLTQAQLQYIMNQEIEQNGAFVSGKIVPTTITKNDVAALPWSDLAGYYPMSTYTYTNTEDESGNGNQGALRNINTVDFQTAPLPYKTTANGDWDTNATWLNGDVQTIPGTTSVVDNAITVDWNIVETSHDITLDNNVLPAANNDERKVLSLNVISNKLTVSGDTGTNEGYGLTVTHYLNLDGVIDLEGESQLIQSLDSDLDASSSGTLQRDQQGTLDLHTYNYWSSPVGASNSTTNNNNYTIPQILKDGTNSASPVNINFITNSYDGTSGSPIGIADYWIWKYANLANNYYNWEHVRSTGTVKAGEGFTMKGVANTNNVLLEQNYVLQGKPHNGEITLPIDPANEYLVGNPYASAIDANVFITDNTNTTGSIYYWEHWGGGSHVTVEYQGGYATYNLSGATPAMQFDFATGGNTGTGASNKLPGRYIPVSQGFFVTGSNSGNIVFNNNQRVFEKEGANSTFIRSVASKNSNTNSNTLNPTANTVNDNRMKIRLGFQSVSTFRRQLLVTVDSSATSQIDFGYDAEINETHKDDMYWMIDSKKFIIQGIDNIEPASILPLGIHTDIDGVNTFVIDELLNVPNDLDIYIYDQVTGLYHDIKNNNGFSIDLPAGTYTDRFELRFSNDNSLSTEEFVAEETGIQFYFTNNNESIVINNPKLTTIESVSLINMLGQEIISFDSIETQDYVTLKTSNISTGNYILNITTIDGKFSKKVLIE